MHHNASASRVLVLLALVASACTDATKPTAVAPPASLTDSKAAAAPGPLETVSLNGATTQIWPYTDDNLDGVPSDPINLIFVGQGDARNVRAALMSLDGNRAEPFAPFTCTWTDAIGDDQAAFGGETGWRGSVIQLECGPYTPLRFHVRLFPMNGWTLANAHLDVIIQGTADHQVLTWELAEQLVVYDLSRSGLLAAAPVQTGQINAAPTFREIPPVIYNRLPLELRALTGGPLFGSVSTGVGIATDGSATVLNLQVAPEAGGTSQTVAITYAQVLPKPVCNSGSAFIRVDGPVVWTRDVRVTAGGVLTSQTFLEGDLIVRTFDIGSGALGPPMNARIRYHYRAHMNDQANSVMNTRHQQLSTDRAPEQLLQELRVSSGGPAQFRSDEKCR